MHAHQSDHPMYIALQFTLFKNRLKWYIYHNNNYYRITYATDQKVKGTCLCLCWNTISLPPYAFPDFILLQPSFNISVTSSFATIYHLPSHSFHQHFPLSYFIAHHASAQSAQHSPLLSSHIIVVCGSMEMQLFTYNHY